MHWLYSKREVTLYICTQFVWRFLRGDKLCRERLHILSPSGDNVCRVRQNMPLRVHILLPTTNCAGATKCAVTRSLMTQSLRRVSQWHDMWCPWSRGYGMKPWPSQIWGLLVFKSHLNQRYQLPVHQPMDFTSEF